MPALLRSTIIRDITPVADGWMSFALPPNPLAAYKMGLSQGREAAYRVLMRLGQPGLCRLGHSVWLHGFWNGEAWKIEGIRIDGTIDRCGD